MPLSGLAVVIPCKNEERWIGQCIDALIRAGVSEIIIVDNGSEDGTLHILERYGEAITLYEKPGLGVSALRNFGASKASAKWLAFVDADVIINPAWLAAVNAFIASNSKHTVTGSTCDTGPTPNWLQSTWHRQLVERDKKGGRYVNSGNMVLSKALFDRIGGFDTSCETGEDVQLCLDAVRLGAQVVKNDAMQAQHMGYPSTINQFYQRERWHGMSMQHALARPWQSRDLLIAAYVLVAGASCTVIIFLEPLLGLSLILASLIPFIAMAIVRTGRRKRLLPLVRLAFLYVIYGVAHADALLRLLTSRVIARAKRA